MSKPKIFISHAQADSKFATALARQLKHKGVDVFEDSQVQAGEDWFESIRASLTASDLVVFVVPLREGEGRFALGELGAARMMNKKIFAVLPDQARYANSDVARVLSKGLMVDAARLTAEQLTQTIIASIPQEQDAA